MTGDKTRQFLEEYAVQAEKCSLIPQEQYNKYNVKLGLRNADGSGVLVGLTTIGEVHGYIIDEGEAIPVEGRLSYRGYDLADLVTGFQKEKRPGFEETVYLLLFGKLPDTKELEVFRNILGENVELPASFMEDNILKAPSKNIMNKIARTVLVLYSFDDDAEDRSIKNVLLQCIGLIAKFPTLIAYAYQAQQHYFFNKSLVIHTPNPKLSVAENFLSLIRDNGKYTKLEAELLDLCLVLHAEHGGGNNSAFSLHVVSSADTDTYSAISTAVGSLKGTKHGGANIKVMEMMEDIKQNVSDWSSDDQIMDYLIKIIEKKAHDKTGLIYGMGHAVYTLSDPRAVLLKGKAKQLAKEKGSEDLYNLYAAIERLSPLAFEKVKKSSKNLCANVDFYSGFVYSMLGLDIQLYTPLFAMARIAGWSAHRLEEIINGKRIIRPAYKQVIQRKQYVSMSDR